MDNCFVTNSRMDIVELSRGVLEGVLPEPGKPGREQTIIITEAQAC